MNAKLILACREIEPAIEEAMGILGKEKRLVLCGHRYSIVPSFYMPVSLADVSTLCI